MFQMIRSIVRLDADQSARRIAMKAFETNTDYYEFEGKTASQTDRQTDKF